MRQLKTGSCLGYLVWSSLGTEEKIGIHDSRFGKKNEGQCCGSSSYSPYICQSGTPNTFTFKADDSISAVQWEKKWAD